MRSRIERPTAGIWSGGTNLFVPFQPRLAPRPSFVSYGFPRIYLCLLAVYVLSRVLINISIARVLIILCLWLLPYGWLAGWLLPLLLSERRRPSAATTTTSFCSAVRVPTTFRSKVTDVARSVYSLPSYRLVRSVWDLSVGLICCPRALPDNDYSTVRST